MKKLLCVLLMLVVMLGLTGCGDEQKKETPQAKEPVEVDVKSEVVTNAIKKADYLTNYSIYAKDSFTFDNYYYIYSALNILCGDKYSCSEIVSIDDINTALSKEFINPPTLDVVDLREYAEKSVDGFMYRIVSDTIKIYDGKMARTDTYFKTIKAEEDGNNLYVYRKIYFLKTTDVTSNSCACNLYATYKDMTSNAIPTQRIESDQSDNIKNCLPKTEKGVIDWDRFNTYKLTFQKKDNKYYFISSELSK